MNEFFLGRQPILDADQRTVGYELLFRSSGANGYDPSIDGDTATANVISNSIIELGLDNIVGAGKAFLNLTEKFLETPEILLTKMTDTLHHQISRRNGFQYFKHHTV